MTPMDSLCEKKTAKTAEGGDRSVLKGIGMLLILLSGAGLGFSSVFQMNRRLRELKNLRRMALLLGKRDWVRSHGAGPGFRADRKKTGRRLCGLCEGVGQKAAVRFRKLHGGDVPGTGGGIHKELGTKPKRF